jgi:tryptophan halogenase
MTATVAILGANLCGWIAAAALARRLPGDRYRVSVVDIGGAADGLGSFAPVVAVPPMFAGFHADLGLTEARLVGDEGGYALGTAFAGWRADGAAGFLPYGEIGAPLDGVPFRQLVGRLRAAGGSVRLADHAAAALAAQAGRFAAEVALPRALVLPVDRYAAAVRDAATAAGARPASAPLHDLAIDDRGTVAAITLADGGRIAPLLVLDCSDGAALAANRVSPAMRSWAQWLPCDRTEVATLPVADAPLLYAQVVAQDAGWQATWSLPGADIRLVCRQGGGGRAFRQGARDAPWRGNTIALGAAACTIEPLHPIAPTLLLRSLARLIQLWPGDPHAPVEAAAYNRATANEQDRARDVVVAHYAAAGRAGGFWDARRAAPPAAVAAKLALFAARGRVPMADDEIFEEDDWAAMLDAMGIVPRRHDALADLIPISAIERHLAAQRAGIVDAVRAIPAYVRRPLRQAARA